jgi:hypothetical protein
MTVRTDRAEEHRKNVANSSSGAEYISETNSGSVILTWENGTIELRILHVDSEDSRTTVPTRRANRSVTCGDTTTSIESGGIVREETNGPRTSVILGKISPRTDPFVEITGYPALSQRLRLFDTESSGFSSTV